MTSPNIDTSLAVVERARLRRSSSVIASSIRVHLERGDERFLRDVHLAELAHLFLALFLLVEELALAGDVAAVAFRGHVLAQRADGFARDDLAADGGLNRDNEHVARDQLFQI